MKPLAGLVRVSHMGARKAGADDFHADEEQIREADAYARELGRRIDYLPPELDTSGGKPIEERPSLLAAIEGVERGRYSGIIVAYLSRLTRSRSGLEIWERVEAAGGHVYCARERLDTSTPTGRYIRDIHLANAVREREEHVERFDNRREGATAAGIWQRRQTPLGYAKNPQTRKLEPNGDAAKVQQAFRDAPNTPRIELARRLGMTPSGVRQLLRNRVYLGELHVGRHSNRTAHPAIVTEDEWLAAQNGGGARPARRHEQPALLAGLVRCASCGHVMSRSRDSYVCHGQRSDGKCPSRVGITMRRLDEYVTGLFRPIIGRVNLTARQHEQDVAEARQERDEARRELAAYLAGVEAAGLDPDEYAEGLRQRKESVTAAENALAALLARQPMVNGKSGLELWDSADVGQRNHLLRSDLEAVVVWPTGRGVVVPASERVRVLKAGAGVFVRYNGGGSALPLRSFAIEEFGGPYVVGP